MIVSAMFGTLQWDPGHSNVMQDIQIYDVQTTCYFLPAASWVAAKLLLVLLWCVPRECLLASTHMHPHGRTGFHY